MKLGIAAIAFLSTAPCSAHPNRWFPPEILACRTGQKDRRGQIGSRSGRSPFTISSERRFRNTTSCHRAATASLAPRQRIEWGKPRPISSINEVPGYAPPAGQGAGNDIGVRFNNWRSGSRPRAGDLRRQPRFTLNTPRQSHVCHDICSPGTLDAAGCALLSRCIDAPRTNATPQ